MRRAPEVCPYWSQYGLGHGNVLISAWRWRGWRPRRVVLSCCPRCNGWWRENGTVAEWKRQYREQRLTPEPAHDP